MLINDLLNGLKDMFFIFLYTCFKCICELIDFIKEIESVEIVGSKGDFLTNLIRSDSVKNAFFTASVIGVVFLIL